MTNESDQLPDWAYTDEEKQDLLYIYDVYSNDEHTGLTMLSRNSDKEQLKNYDIELRWKVTKVLDEYQYNALMTVLNRYKYDTQGVQIDGDMITWKCWMDNIV